MKSTLKAMFVSLLTGISFTVGVMLILLAKDIYVEKQGEDETWVDYPEGVVVTNHSIKPNMPRLTIVGEIHNGSSQHLKSVWVDVDVFAGHALVNTCDDSFRHVPAQTSKPFEVQCCDVAGTDLPDYIRYEVRVRTGLYGK